MAWDIAGLHINQCAEFRGRRRNNSALLRVVLVRRRFTVRYGLVECWRSSQKRRQQLGKRSTDERSRCGRRSSSAHFRTVSPTGMRRWWSGEAGSRQPGQPARARWNSCDWTEPGWYSDARAHHAVPGLVGRVVPRCRGHQPLPSIFRTASTAADVGGRRPRLLRSVCDGRSRRWLRDVINRCARPQWRWMDISIVRTRTWLIHRRNGSYRNIMCKLRRKRGHKLNHDTNANFRQILQ